MSSEQKDQAAIPEVSVIMGTYNRLALLCEAIKSIRASIGNHTYEIVISDGGSTDGTREFLEKQPDIVLVKEPGLEGAVKAFNRAHDASSSNLICNFNDDCTFVGDSLAKAVEYMKASPEDVGQLAFEYNMWGPWRVHSENLSWGNIPCSNVGIVKRDVQRKVAQKQGGSFWSETYRTYCGDTEQSLWVWRLGYKVVVVPGLRVSEKGQAFDAMKTANVSLYVGPDGKPTPGGDLDKFIQRWRTPKGHPEE